MLIQIKSTSSYWSTFQLALGIKTGLVSDLSVPYHVVHNTSGGSNSFCLRSTAFLFDLSFAICFLPFLRIQKQLLNTTFDILSCTKWIVKKFLYMIC